MEAPIWFYISLGEDVIEGFCNEWFDEKYGKELTCYNSAKIYKTYSSSSSETKAKEDSKGPHR